MTSRLSTSLQSPRDLMNCRSRQFLVLADFRGIFQLGLCVQLQGHLDSTCSEQRGRRGPEGLENRFRMNFHNKLVRVPFVHSVGYKKGASEQCLLSNTAPMQVSCKFVSVMLHTSYSVWLFVN